MTAAAATESGGLVTPSQGIYDGAGTQPHDDQQGLADDGAGHLRGAGHPLAEDDRDLAHPRPAPMRPPGGLDLECIAVRICLSHADGVECLPAPGFEATGQVAIRQEQDGPCEERPGTTD